MRFTSDDGLIFYLGVFITILGLIAYITTLFYFNSTYFLERKFKSLGLKFESRLSVDINEKNPFTGLRNNDIRKMHFDDGPSISKRAFFYYDKVIYLDKHGIEKIAWIKVSFGGFRYNEIVFFSNSHLDPKMF